MSKQVFHPYSRWETFHAGMYRQPVDLPAEAERSRALLADAPRFEDAAAQMVTDWPIAAEHNLTGAEHRRSWVGQATCCYVEGSTETATRAAWALMTDAQRDAANDAASRVIVRWERGRGDAEALFAV
jgi:hypothetical protein